MRMTNLLWGQLPIPFGKTPRNDKILVAIIIRDPESRDTVSSNLQVILLFGTNTCVKCDVGANCKLQLDVLRKRIRSATSKELDLQFTYNFPNSHWSRVPIQGINNTYIKVFDDARRLFYSRIDALGCPRGSDASPFGGTL